MQAHEINEVVCRWLAAFSKLSRPYFPLMSSDVRIIWNPRMRSRAGLADPNRGRVELNPHLIRDLKTLEQVLVHELCHLAIAKRWPRAEAHGARWKELMRHLGFVPQRCHTLTVANLRVQKRWTMVCGCQRHEISTTVFNRIKRGLRYRCLSCQQPLSPVV